jgi:hypothetical protein
MKKTLQKSLIMERTIEDICYIEIEQILKWFYSIGFNKGKELKKHIDSEQKPIHNKYFVDQVVPKRSHYTENEKLAEIWTKEYLKSIGSLGVIKSIRTGRHDKFIMCNLRNMNECHDVHDDYFNDSTVYINFLRNEYSLRCNRVPCNKKPWVWKPMV